MGRWHQNKKKKSNDTHKLMIYQLLKYEELDLWESKFLISIEKENLLSERQIEKLDQIHSKYERA